MKRTNAFVIVFILVIILIRPAFAIAQEADNENVKVSAAGLAPASETFLLNNEESTAEIKLETSAPSETSENSETTKTTEVTEITEPSEPSEPSESSEESEEIDKVEESIEDSQQEEETEDNQKEDNKKNPEKKEEPKEKNNWLEKSSGRQLNALKSRLTNLQNIYNVNYRTFRIANAINTFEKADNHKKRNNAYLLDLTKQIPFTVYASSYIFPELIKLNVEKFNSYLFDVEKTITDEIKDTPEEIEKLMEDISKSVDNYLLVSDFYEKLAIKNQEKLDELIKINSKNNNLTPIGFYIKNTNKQIIEIVKKQIESMLGISDQLKLAVEYSKEQIVFMNRHNQSIPVKGKYIAEIRSSFKDFEKFLESYENKQEFNIHLFSTNCTNRFNDVEKLIGKEEIRESHIKKSIKTNNFVLPTKQVNNYNEKENLEKAFVLFELAEINKELSEQLLVFIDGESWQSRYEEPNDESDKDKADKEPTTLPKGQKPKLIDFEEE